MAKTKERIEGSERAQYARLREYAMEILNTNPGSTVNICTTPMPDSTVLFRRIYICLDACRKGFLPGCRPFINLDGTFLRGYYGGQLLTAVSQDANNHIYPIAYAIVDSETKDNWKWFLQLLQEDLGDQRNNYWTFMSDQQKGLIRALEDVVPGAHHRNKKELRGYNGRLCPVQQSRLEKNKKQSSSWKPFWIGDDAGNIFEVQCLPMKVSVDLEKHTYTCRLWQLTGIPCKHACAALAHQNRRAEDVAHTWLTIGAYNATYQFLVQPVPSQEYWQQLDTIPILPPHYKRLIGWPTKKRDTSRDAPKVNPDPYRTKRKYGQIKCKYCLEEGHNSRSCKAKKEAMVAAATAADATAHGQNSSAATTAHVPPANVAQDEDDERLAEMYWEETLEDAEAEAALDAAAAEFEASLGVGTQPQTTTTLNPSPNMPHTPQAPHQLGHQPQK
ncbi:uncharacterized protein [Arachis hypogaea]|uniref:uncharacterized protein n=1 Tax=Arachis hypogaea TaxID=3818 RepID=UPI003B20BC8D